MIAEQREPRSIAALRILADAAEMAIERPLPLVKQNERRRIAEMAIMLARETLLIETGAP